MRDYIKVASSTRAKLLTKILFQFALNGFGLYRLRLLLVVHSNTHIHTHTVVISLSLTIPLSLSHSLLTEHFPSYIYTHIIYSTKPQPSLEQFLTFCDVSNIYIYGVLIFTINILSSQSRRCKESKRNVKS